MYVCNVILLGAGQGGGGEDKAGILLQGSWSDLVR